MHHNTFKVPVQCFAAEPLFYTDTPTKDLNPVTIEEDWFYCFALSTGYLAPATLTPNTPNKYSQFWGS